MFLALKCFEKAVLDLFSLLGEECCSAGVLLPATKRTAQFRLGLGIPSPCSTADDG